MQVKVGDKVTNPLPNGLLWPSIAVTPQTSEVVTVVNRSTGLPVDITVTRADFISLRETREGVEYLAVTNEVVQYGYRSVAMPRFSTVIGLDADADGTIRTLDQNMAEHAVTYSEWQEGNFESRRGAVSAADL